MYRVAYDTPEQGRQVQHESIDPGVPEAPRLSYGLLYGREPGRQAMIGGQLRPYLS